MVSFKTVVSNLRAVISSRLCDHIEVLLLVHHVSVAFLGIGNDLRLNGVIVMVGSCMIMCFCKVESSCDGYMETSK